MGFIDIKEAIALGNGEGGYANLSMVEWGILQNISASRVIYLRSPLSGTFEGKGTIRYSLTKFPEVRAYNKTANASQIADLEDFYVHLEDPQVIKIETEGLDIQHLSGALSPVAQLFIANAVRAYEADLKAKFYIKQLEFFKANPDKTLFFPELAERKVLSLNRFKYLQKELAWSVQDMCKIFSKRYLQVPTTEFVGAIDGFAQINLEQGLTAMNLSTKAFDVLTNGYVGRNNGTIIPFGQLNLIIDNILNVDVAKGASFNGDYSIDFATEGFIGSIHHQWCMLYPLSPLIAKQTISPDNGNDIVIMKYQWGFGIAYDDLCRGLFNKIKLFTDKNGKTFVNKEVKVGETLQLHSNVAASRSLTWSSADNTIATVDNNGLVTGVKAGTVKINAKLVDSENEFSQEFVGEIEINVVA